MVFVDEHLEIGNQCGRRLVEIDAGTPSNPNEFWPEAAAFQTSSQASRIPEIQMSGRRWLPQEPRFGIVQPPIEIWHC